MPVFKGVASRAKPHKAIEYITDPAKAVVVETLNLVPGENYAERFMQTAASFGKNDKPEDRKYYHFKFSPSPEDKVSPKVCQAAAMKLARKLFGDYECVVATHTDSGVVHSHIVVNSVSLTNGRKLHVDDAEYRAMKDLANEVGLSFGMTPLDWRSAVKEKLSALAAGAHVSTGVVEQRIILRGGVSWKDELREVIDLAKSKCDNIIAFEDFLEKYGVTLSRHTSKTISYLHPNKERAIRGSTLGERYTAEAIERCFLEKERHEPLLADGYLQQLLRELQSKPDIKEYCERLTCREEIRLFMRNVAVSTATDTEYYKALSDYGVKTVLTEGVPVYSYNGYRVYGSELGTNYITRKEILSNVIDKQGHGLDSRRGKALGVGERRAGASAEIGDGERRAAHASRDEQAVNAQAFGLRSGDGQAVQPRGEHGTDPAGAEKLGNGRPEHRDGGTLRATDNKLQDAGRHGAEHGRGRVETGGLDEPTDSRNHNRA